MWVSCVSCLKMGAAPPPLPPNFDSFSLSLPNITPPSVRCSPPPPRQASASDFALPSSARRPVPPVVPFKVPSALVDPVGGVLGVLQATTTYVGGW